MKYYLQRICVLLKHKECEQDVLQMKSFVEKQGILVDVIYLHNGKGDCFQDSEKTEGYENITILSKYKKQKSDCAASIYVSDSSDCLRKYATKDLPVLAYYHEYNKEENFSGISYGCEKIEQLDAAYFDRVYRRCKTLPWDILETERCILRETTVADVDAFYEIYREPSITKYMEDLFPEREKEIAYTQDYIKNIYEFYDFGVWTVVWKETGEVIGRAGISYREGYETPELGFIIGVLWQRKGVAFEICSAILQYGNEMFGFEEFQALVEKENEISIKLCHKLGFDADEEVWSEGKSMLRMVMRYGRQ